MAFDANAELLPDALQSDAHSGAIATEALGNLLGGKVFKVAELDQAARVGGESPDAPLQRCATVGSCWREFRPRVRELRE